MIWQDIVLTIVMIVFSVSLVPQVYYGFRKKEGTITLITSGPTFVGLYVAAVVYATLSLTFSAIVSFFTATLWFILFLQRLIYKKV